MSEYCVSGVSSVPVEGPCSQILGRPGISHPVTLFVPFPVLYVSAASTRCELLLEAGLVKLDPGGIRLFRAEARGDDVVQVGLFICVGEVRRVGPR